MKTLFLLFFCLPLLLQAQQVVNGNVETNFYEKFIANEQPEKEGYSPIGYIPTPYNPLNTDNLIIQDYTFIQQLAVQLHKNHQISLEGKSLQLRIWVNKNGKIDRLVYIAANDIDPQTIPIIGQVLETILSHYTLPTLPSRNYYFSFHIKMPRVMNGK